MRALDVEALSNRLFVIKNSRMEDTATYSGGNSTLFVTDEGAILVDTKLPEWG